MKRTFAETVKILCYRKKAFVKADGSLNVKGLADDIGMNQPTLKRILDGSSGEPREDNAEKLRKYFKVTHEQLMGQKPLPNEALEWGEDLGDWEAIPEVNIRLRATNDGHSGFTVHFEDDATAKPLYYRKDWLKEKGYKSKYLIAATVSGSSMEPALFNGDRILINRESRKLIHGRAYWVVIDGQSCAKRMKKKGPEWWITSDNPAHSKTDVLLENEQQIIGEIVERSTAHI